jgi:5-hydroxyisourate hydrolase
MSGISTHILDTSLGRPAAGVPVILDRADGLHWLTCASAITDADGRCKPLLDASLVAAGKYRLTFEIAPYFARLHQATLYPEIVITFLVAADAASYHIPLLLNPFGYTTYRGS